MEDKEEVKKEDTDANAVRQITMAAKQPKHVRIDEDKNVTVTIDEPTEQQHNEEGKKAKKAKKPAEEKVEMVYRVKQQQPSAINNGSIETNKEDELEEESK